MLARKAIKQSLSNATISKLLPLMQAFQQMTNDAIRIGLTYDISSLKKLSKLTHKELKKYKQVSSYYRLCAISKAAGILSARKKSIKRGRITKDPLVKRPLLVSCYGFKIIDQKLCVPLGGKKYEFIPLNAHTMRTISDDNELQVRSFTITEKSSLSLCIAKEVPEIAASKVTGTIGIDRNLRNLTAGNSGKVTYYDMSKIVEIGETTKDIVRSFKRNDVRIRRVISSKYGKRKRSRTLNILNLVSKDIVEHAFNNKKAIVLENIKDIRSLYRKGNGQGPNYRRRMNNNWPFAEIKRQIVYKAQWAGVPIIHLTKGETRGTSSLCYQCGERLQSSRSKDHERELWCNKCEKWFDRDYVAVMNISYKGWLRFDQSQKGIGIEAMSGNPTTTTAIQRVDPMKLASSKKLERDMNALDAVLHQPKR